MFLPLGESILPVLMEKLSEAALAIYTKVDHNGIGVMVSELQNVLNIQTIAFPFGVQAMLNLTVPSCSGSSGMVLD
jgi:spore maturation protein SpmA